MKKEKVAVCIFGSDFHLTDKRYVCRKEEDWYGYQEGVLDWLNGVCEEKKVPLVIVGDIFDRPTHPPQLINLAIDHLPFCYVTSGNHDVLYHNKQLQHKSAYGSLIRSDKAMELTEPLEIYNGITIYPFHFGEEYYDCPKKDGFNILIGHELVWQGKEPFEGAPAKGNVEEIRKRVSGYDLMVFGDMHEFFYNEDGDTKVLNNGSLMRITSDQIDYQPYVHCLYSDGSIEHIEVPCENDKISREHLDDKKRVDEKINSFVKRMKQEDGNKENFSKAPFEERVGSAILSSRANERVVEIIKRNMI